MSNRTKYLSRLIGLYCLLVSLIMFSQKQAIVQIENTLIHSPAMLFILGIFTLVGGLAMVLAHNQWSGGALPVAVTLIGWISLIKGFLIAVPQAAVSLWGDLQYERFYYLYVGISFALGVGFTYAGFDLIEFHRRQPRDVSDRRERPRVAA